MKFIKNNYKKITPFVVIMLIALISYSATQSSYAETTTKTFTREEIQNMIVSTAVSYLRNNTYSDYDQHSMDASSTYNGSTSITTFNWRDFNITPEMVSRTNNFHDDCSSFVTQVLINSIDYDFSNYYTYTSNLFYVFNNFTYNKANSSKANFIKGYQNAGKSVSTFFFNKLASTQAGVSAGTEYKNDKTLVNYYYEFTGNETSTERNTIKSSVKQRLQPGDIVVYRHKTSSGSLGGHVMVYAEDFYDNEGNKMTGFIHSTGTSYNFTTETLNRDKYAIRTGTIEDKIDGIIDDEYTTSYMILRPINDYCSSNDSCSLTVPNNSLARPSMTDLKIEQYISNDTKNISKYNSVNINETITYNLDIKNIKINPIKNITISASTPSNTTYVSCNNDCKYSNNEITWTLDNNSEITSNTYSYTVKVNKETTITNTGFKIKNSDNTILQMSELNTNINPSINNQLDTNVLTSIIKLSQELNENEYLTYGTSTNDNTYKTDITTINENNKITISSVDYIRFLYYNAYGIDLSTMTKDNIKTSLFNTQSGLYSRKTTNNDAISQMLVPGLYGGRLLKGNDNNDRTRFMVYNDLEIGDIITYYTSSASLINIYIYLGQENNYPTFLRLATDNTITKLTDTSAEDLFNALYAKSLFAIFRPTRYYGVTITLQDNNKTDHITLAKNTTYRNLPIIEKKYTVTYEYNTTPDNECKDKDVVDDIFDGWYKDSTKVDETTTITDQTTHTLTAKYTNKEITLPSPVKNGFKFDGWYEDSTLQNKASETNTYTPESDITLYAKWVEEKSTEPDTDTDTDPDKDKDTDTDTDPDKDKDPEPVEEFNITSDKFTIEDGYIYLNESNKEFTSYIDNLKYSKTFNYTLKLYDENKEITNNIIFTGSKLKAIDNDTVIKEYINIVKGDVNKTGTVTMADVMKLVDYLFDSDTMTEAYNLKAGDVNSTNTVTMADVMKLVDYILEGGEL